MFPRKVIISIPQVDLSQNLVRHFPVVEVEGDAFVQHGLYTGLGQGILALLMGEISDDQASR